MSVRRNYLRIAVLLFGVMPWLMACQQNSTTTIAIDSVDTLLHQQVSMLPDTINSEVRLQVESEHVKERVEGIFKIVKAEVLSNGGIITGELLDRCYCTESWNRLLLAVHRKEEQSFATFYNIDYWCMLREPDIVTFDQFVVTRLSLGERMTASVAYTVYGHDTYTPAEVDLVFEKGQWLIDNFHNYRYMINVRHSMKEFLALQ